MLAPALFNTVLLVKEQATALDEKQHCFTVSTVKQRHDS